MAMYITTLKNKETGAIEFPRTKIQALSDTDENSLDENLKASDINILKNGKIAQIYSALEELAGRIPAVPSADGTYVLKATVSDGVVNYSWVAES